MTAALPRPGTTGASVQGFLSPTAAAGQAHPLRCWRAAQVASLEAALRQSLMTWHAACGLGDPDRPEPRATVVPACETAIWGASPPLWHSLGLPSDPNRLWWSLQPSLPGPLDGIVPRGAPLDPRAVLAWALFGDTAALRTTWEGLGFAVASSLWEDGWRHLATLLFPDPTTRPEWRFPDPDDAPTPLPRPLQRPWVGGLVVNLEWCGQTLLLALDAATSAQAIGAHPPADSTSPVRAGSEKPPLVPVAQAIRVLPATVQVCLSPFDLDLGALWNLRTGDVIGTSHALDRPMELLAGPTESLPESRFLGQAALGRLGEQRGIHLLERPSPPGRRVSAP